MAQNAYALKCKSKEFKVFSSESSYSDLATQVERELLGKLSNEVGSEWVVEYQQALSERDFARTFKLESEVMFKKQNALILPPSMNKNRSSLSNSPSVETYILTLKHIKAAPHRFVLEAFESYKRFCKLKNTENTDLVKLQRSWSLEYSGFSDYHVPVFVDGLKLSSSSTVKGFGKYLSDAHRLFYGELGIEKVPQGAIEQFVLDSMLVLNPKCESCRDISLLSGHSPKAFDSMGEIAIELGPSGLYRRISHPEFEFVDFGKGNVTVQVESLLGEKFVKSQKIRLKFVTDREGTLEKNNPYGLRLVNIEIDEIFEAENRVLD